MQNPSNLPKFLICSQFQVKCVCEIQQLADDTDIIAKVAKNCKIVEHFEFSGGWTNIDYKNDTLDGE